MRNGQFFPVFIYESHLWVRRDAEIKIGPHNFVILGILIVSKHHLDFLSQLLPYG